MSNQIGAHGGQNLRAVQYGRRRLPAPSLVEWSAERNSDLEIPVDPSIEKYNEKMTPADQKICDILAAVIDRGLPGSESKIWHAHPVWFLDGNPIVGYSRQKRGIRLMFWSGADFDEAGLNVVGPKFKDASVFYNDASEIRKADLRRWLKKARVIQWDYKNIVRRKGRLERLKPDQESRNMKSTSSHDERIASMTFASVYPHYVTKVERKGRTKAELHQVIEWLTGYSEKDLRRLIKDNVTFAQFFEHATLNPNAQLITGVICGYRVEEIENPLTRNARYLDKLVDELAKGRKMEKILRSDG
jgi:hypothetical protein